MPSPASRFTEGLLRALLCSSSSSRRRMMFRLRAVLLLALFAGIAHSASEDCSAKVYHFPSPSSESTFTGPPDDPWSISVTTSANKSLNCGVVKDLPHIYSDLQIPEDCDQVTQEAEGDHANELFAKCKSLKKILTCDRGEEDHHSCSCTTRPCEDCRKTAAEKVTMFMLTFHTTVSFNSFIAFGRKGVGENVFLILPEGSLVHVGEFIKNPAVFVKPKLRVKEGDSMTIVCTNSCALAMIELDFCSKPVSLSYVSSRMLDVSALPSHASDELPTYSPSAKETLEPFALEQTSEPLAESSIESMSTPIFDLENLPESSTSHSSLLDHPDPQSFCNGYSANITFRYLSVGAAVNGGQGFTLYTKSLGRNDTNDASAVFDTSNPPPNDLDLGSPNEMCLGGGPGKGFGGQPGSEGENCEPLGNVLIAHSGNVSALRLACSRCTFCDECRPDDSPVGAEFVLTLTEDGILHAVTALDVDESPNSISITKPSGEKLSYSGLGDNSKLIIPLGDVPVHSGDEFKVLCIGSCALVEVSRTLCYPESELLSEVDMVPPMETISMANLPNFNSDVDESASPTKTPVASTSTMAMETSFPSPQDIVTIDKSPVEPTAIPIPEAAENIEGIVDGTVETSAFDVSEASDEVGTIVKWTAPPSVIATPTHLLQPVTIDKSIPEETAIPDPTPFTLCKPLVERFDGFATGFTILGLSHWTLEACRNDTSGETCGVSAAFNTSTPNDNDYYLGSPNNKCPGGGPGVGWGGEPGRNGENCEPLGQVLIAAGGDVDAMQTECTYGECRPTDHPGPASFKFTFHIPIKILSLAILDLDDTEGAGLVTFPDGHVENIHGYGDNSVTRVDFHLGAPTRNMIGVDESITVSCRNSCAIAEFMYDVC